MKTLIGVLLTLALCGTFATGVAASADSATSPAQPAAYPALARVTSYRASRPANSSRQAARQSRAFVVEEDGFLMTSYRTLLDPQRETLLNRIDVELLSEPGHRYPATIVSVEPTLNLAILKIEADHKLAVSTIQDRAKITPGKAVYALGDGDHRQPRFARGFLTAVNSKECYQESMTATMLRAAIDLPETALGGPLFDNSGAVVGVHTGYEEPDPGADENGQHILPIFLAFNIYDSIKYKKSYKSPWTGFSVRPLTGEERAIFPFRRFFGGIAIEQVWDNSPAARNGVREGDILVRFSYYPVHSPAEFQKWLYLYGVGEKVKLHFIRGGEDYISYDYTIEERPGWAVPR